MAGRAVPEGGMIVDAMVDAMGDSMGDSMVVDTDTVVVDTNTAVAADAMVVDDVHSHAKPAPAPTMRPWATSPITTTTTTTADTTTTTTSPSSFSKPAFFAHVAAELAAGLDVPTLLRRSRAMTASLWANVADVDSYSMLPSFIGHAPTGRERGRALAVDVGGSTMRVATVRLGEAEEAAAAAGPQQRPPAVPGLETAPLAVEQARQWAIEPAVKELAGERFFDWVAGNIRTFLEEDLQGGLQADLPLGLVWSFPINQTHLNDGTIKSTGKGFNVGRDLLGQSMHACLQAAFARAGLPRLRLEAIVNDSVSVLLALAYRASSVTSLSVVAGTGFNGAVQMPAAALPPAKYGARHPGWRAAARDVLVDAELCVTGRAIFPLTAWDRAVFAILPPRAAAVLGLEVLVGALFVGEILRQVIVDAVQRVGFLGGVLPAALQAPYSLKLEAAALLLSDDPVTQAAARARLPALLGLAAPLADDDYGHLHATATALMARTAALVAAAVFAMQSLHDEAYARYGVETPSRPTPEWCPVSCVGSVLEKNAGVRQQSQDMLDRLAAAAAEEAAAAAAAGTPSQPPPPPRLRLVVDPTSSMTGVAVAALMARHAPEAAVAATGTPLVDTAVGAEDRGPDEGTDKQGRDAPDMASQTHVTAPNAPPNTTTTTTRVPADDADTTAADDTVADASPASPTSLPPDDDSDTAEMVVVNNVGKGSDPSTTHAAPPPRSVTKKPSMAQFPQHQQRKPGPRTPWWRAPLGRYRLWRRKVKALEREGMRV